MKHRKTNEALISALESASKMTDREVICYMDSELVVKHLNGEYNIRNPKLRTLWLKVQEAKQSFRNTIFHHVPRTDIHIQEVDKLANQTIDKVSMRL